LYCVHSRRVKGSLVAREVLNNDDRLQQIETRLEAIETVAQETNAMLKALCHNGGVTPSLHSGHGFSTGSASTSAGSTASSRLFSPRPSPLGLRPAQDVVAKGQRPGVEGSSQVCIGLIPILPRFNEVLAKRWRIIFTLPKICARGRQAISGRSSRGSQKLSSCGWPHSGLSQGGVLTSVSEW
jgi:hypothetical protein